MKSVIQIVEDVMEQVKVYGSKHSTISMMYYGIFKPIINRHIKEGIIEYKSEIVEDFRNEYEKRLTNKTISQSHMATVKRALQYLTSYAETRSVDFSKVKKPLKIIVSDYHMKLIKDCMESDTKGNNNTNLNIYMRHFFRFIESKYPNYDVITDEMFRSFILDTSLRYPKSIGSVMHAVRILMNFLRSRDLIEGKADFSVFSPKSPRTIMQGFYTEDEVNSILSTLENDSVGKRNKAIILLGYGNGLRASDVINLSKNDIDWKHEEIHLIQRKTGEALRLSLNATTMNSIADYILKGRPECSFDNIFVSSVKPYRPLSAHRLSNMMTELSKKAGVAIIPGRAFHGLRRSYAINLAEAGVELDIISQMLGHKSFRSDRQYLTFNREQTMFCAMDFSMVPITVGIYHSIVQGGEKI